MIRFLAIFLIGLLLCTACQKSPEKGSIVEASGAMAQCNSSCEVDSDCFVISETCFLHAGLVFIQSIQVLNFIENLKISINRLDF